MTSDRRRAAPSRPWWSAQRARRAAPSRPWWSAQRARRAAPSRPWWSAQRARRAAPSRPWWSALRARRAAPRPGGRLRAAPARFARPAAAARKRRRAQNASGRGENAKPGPATKRTREGPQNKGFGLASAAWIGASKRGPWVANGRLPGSSLAGVATANADAVDRRRPAVQSRLVTLRARRSRAASTSARSMPWRASVAAVK